MGGLADSWRLVNQHPNGCGSDQGRPETLMPHDPHGTPRGLMALCCSKHTSWTQLVFPEKVVHPALVKCILYCWQMLELLLDSMISCLELHFIHLLTYVMICWRVWSHSVCADLLQAVIVSELLGMICSTISAAVSRRIIQCFVHCTDIFSSVLSGAKRIVGTNLTPTLSTINYEWMGVKNYQEVMPRARFQWMFGQYHLWAGWTPSDRIIFTHWQSDF